MSPHVPSLRPLTTSPSHLPLFPLMFPHLPLSSLTSFLSSLLPPLTSPHVLLPSPLMPRPSSPLVSPHCLSSLCPLLSPHHLPVSSPLVISPCLPSHPFTTSPAVSLCPLTACPSSPSPPPLSPAVPRCPRASGPVSIRARLSRAAAGKGERDPLSSRSGLAAAVAAGGRRQAGAPAQLGDRGQGGPASAPLCPGPSGLAVRVPSPRPARCHRVCHRVCRRALLREQSTAEVGASPPRERPAGGRLSWGHTKPCSGVRAGFVAEGRVPVVARSERGRLALPRGRAGAARSGRLSLQIPTVRCCRRWRKSFWEGDDDRLMKPIKQ